MVQQTHQSSSLILYINFPRAETDSSSNLLKPFKNHKILKTILIVQATQGQVMSVIISIYNIYEILSRGPQNRIVIDCILQVSNIFWIYFKSVLLTP